MSNIIIEINWKEDMLISNQLIFDLRNKKYFFFNNEYLNTDFEEIQYLEITSDIAFRKFREKFIKQLKENIEPRLWQYKKIFLKWWKFGAEINKENNIYIFEPMIDYIIKTDNIDTLAQEVFLWRLKTLWHCITPKQMETLEMNVKIVYSKQ